LFGFIDTALSGGAQLHTRGVPQLLRRLSRRGRASQDRDRALRPGHQGRQRQGRV